MKKLAYILLFTFMFASCNGKGPSRLLRQGQSPFFDFPLYLSEGVPGKIWKYERSGPRKLLVEGLNDPRGIATDRSNNLYVAERGGNRLLKVNTSTGAYTVVRDNLASPAIVAVDSFGEPFVTEDTNMRILRGSDGRVVATFTTIPSSLTFGVEDTMIVGLFDSNEVRWGGTGPAATVNQPVGLGTDANGRVYVAEGVTNQARIIRYHQRTPTGETVVADNLSGLSGIVVDPVGNVYAIEQANFRIIIVGADGLLYSFANDPIDPQYLAFTQY